MRTALLAAVAAACLAAPGLNAQILVVGNKTADTAGFIDLEIGEMVATRPTGSAPHEVAISPDGNTAAVVSYGSGSLPGHTISLFDIPTATPLQVVDLGDHTRPHGIVWMPDGMHLLVTTEGSGHLVKVRAETGEVVATYDTGQRGSHMVAIAPDATRAYVANLGNNSFSVIDLVVGERLAIVPAGEESEGIAVTPDGREIWVSNRGEDSLFVYDAETLERKASIATGSIPIRVTIGPDGRYAAASNARDGSLTIIDVVAKTPVATVPVAPEGGGAGVPVTAIFHPDGSHLFVALTNAAQIAIVDTSEWRQIETIAAGEGSDGLGYSPHRLTIQD